MTLTMLDPILLGLVDAVFAALPRAVPSPDLLDQARIVSHRGERTKPGVLEGTFAAYDPLVGSGVAGLECDVRFTRDEVPVIYHDADLRRLYGCHERLADLDFETLRRRFPLIPRFDELVSRYGGQLILMIEFKAEARPNPDKQLKAVAEALAELQPAQDYFAMSLDVSTLDWLGGLPTECRAPIARSNVTEMCRYAQTRHTPLMTGHYALIGRRRAHRLQRSGHELGAGFPHSRNALYYTLDLGARWIFTNEALKMQQFLTQARERARNPSSN